MIFGSFSNTSALKNKNVKKIRRAERTLKQKWQNSGNCDYDWWL